MSSHILSPDVFTRYFSNFSDHTIEYKGVSYPTSEHAYHCARYSDPDIKSEILSAPSAKDAWEISQKYKSKQDPGFKDKKVQIMKDILQTKLNQHADVLDALLQSGNMEIVKNEPKDAFWGTGPDGQGRNELGKLWMDIRKEIAASRDRGV